VNGRGEDWAADFLDFLVDSRANWLAWVHSRRAHRIATGIAVGALLIAAVTFELKTSWFESLVFRAADEHLTYHLAEGPSKAISYPLAGPYDWTLGYARMPVFLARLKAAGFQVMAQAHPSKFFSLISRSSLYPVYAHKDQAGLEIVDQNGASLYSFDRPERIYNSYSDIPPVVVQTLLFIENRDLLDPRHPHRNPAVEWDRLSKAVLDYGLHAVDHGRPVIGGSTLATQLEKFRHSPGGRTHSAVEKLRQMASATLAAYRNGAVTLQAQKKIVCDYLNSIPLAASRGYGEVAGLGDGLWAWYGTDISKVNPLLRADEATLTHHQIRERAQAYREVLSLLLALRAPHLYLVDHPKALAAKTDRYLRALAERGVISRELRDFALAARVQPLGRAPGGSPVNFVENKAQNTIRTALLPLLGLNSTYDLDRLDLTVQTSLDREAQESITHFIEGLSNPKNAAAAGLTQYRLLEQSDPSKVIYSFTLYERGPGVNLLRVQTDNLDQPLNINQDTKLELGSTAKLRTLINYLQIVADLHKQYAGMASQQLAAVKTLPDDHITEWAVKYLETAPDRSLMAMLQAALQRKYSGSTGESFFTGGGVHQFENFEPWEGGQNFTVSAAFQNSVNLAFVRLMRDIVYYYRFRVPGASPAVINETDDPARRAYLARFADQEGRVYLWRFYQKYRGQTPDQSLATLMHGIPYLTPLRAAVIYRSIRPQAALDQFTAFLKAHLPKEALANPKDDPATLFEKYGPDKFDLSDRGYLAHVHPLELWLLHYREQHPHADWDELAAKSVSVRQDVYWWLFKTEHKGAQDNRIWTLLEQDAFNEIHKAWKSQGYPFDSLVPSYATTIGVSGDTPAALADLMGIILNGGVRYPTVKIEQLHFGQRTPTETVADRKIGAGQRVMAPEIAALVRQELLGVVQNGTGRRLATGIQLSDGSVIPAGGKTGTGDNRLESFTAHGSLLGSKVVNRTATFVFTLGNRYYGTVLAFVPGSKAASYRFTSALAVQVLKDLTPQLAQLIGRPRHAAQEQLALAFHRGDGR
jgi:membrane peptidoglycan carboxypeptidase